MRIKAEYKGKTIVKHTTVRNIIIVVDNIDVSKYKYYVSIGMGYLFFYLRRNQKPRLHRSQSNMRASSKK
jgi:hypothetical protein